MKKVSVFDDVLSEDTFLQVQNFLNQITNDRTTSFIANTMFWDKDLVENSTPVLIYNFKNTDVEIYKLVEKEIKDRINLNIYSMIVHVWPPLSYITWHTDRNYEGGLTIYLNDKWNPNWGGYFMYKTDDNITALKPKRNLGVFQLGGVEHCVSTTNIGCDLRYTLQIFFRKDKKTI